MGSVTMPGHMPFACRNRIAPRKGGSTIRSLSHFEQSRHLSNPVHLACRLAIEIANKRQSSFVCGHGRWRLARFVHPRS